MNLVDSQNVRTVGITGGGGFIGRAADQVDDFRRGEVDPILGEHRGLLSADEEPRV